MITIDEDSNELDFNKGNTTDFDSFQELQVRVRKIANDFLLNFSIKVFGKSIQPRDFAYKAKMQEDKNMNENMVTPVNSHLLGKVLNILKDNGEMRADDLSNQVGVHISDLQPVLNSLVTDGRIKTGMNFTGPVSYYIAVDEAVTEGLNKMTGSRKTSKQTFENVKLIVRHKKPVNEETRRC